MTENTPVVLSDNNALHKPLEPGNKLPTDSIPVSANPRNNISIKSDGLFAPTFSGITAVNHDYTLDGDGSSNNPLSVRVSNLKENIIQVRQHADNSGGLYIWEGNFMSSVIHNNSMDGTGKSDDNLRVRVSNKTNNRLLSMQLPVTSGGGLYTKPQKVIKCADKELGFVCNGLDDPSAESACGKFGSGVYWKLKITLNDADTGDNNILVYPQLVTLPCKSDGALVPFQLKVDYPQVISTVTPYIYLYLICSEIPTHHIVPSTLYKSEIRRSATITTPTGLDDVYNTGNSASGVLATLRYIYTK